jgi:hypothetical protein
MANRSFKMMGRAYAESGDVTVTVTVAGSQVFNGAVTTQNTALSAPPTLGDLSGLVTWTMDESVVNEQSLSVTVSGGDFVMGPTMCNNLSADTQTLIANTFGSDALGADLYNGLVAGTVTSPSDAQKNTMNTLNAGGSMNTDAWVWLVNGDDAKKSAQIDGANITEWTDDHLSARSYYTIPDGSTFTATWDITPSNNWDHASVPDAEKNL